MADTNELIRLGGIEAAVATKHKIGKKAEGKGPQRLVTEAQRAKVKVMVSKVLRRAKRAPRASIPTSEAIVEAPGGSALRRRLLLEASRFEARAKALRTAAGML